MPKVKPGQIGMELKPVLSPEFVEAGWTLEFSTKARLTDVRAVHPLHGATPWSYLEKRRGLKFIELYIKRGRYCVENVEKERREVDGVLRQ